MENNPNKLFMWIKFNYKLSNDIYIHFSWEKEIGKFVILKTHSETLRSILKKDADTERDESVLLVLCFIGCFSDIISSSKKL